MGACEFLRMEFLMNLWPVSKTRKRLYWVAEAHADLVERDRRARQVAQELTDRQYAQFPSLLANWTWTPHQFRPSCPGLFDWMDIWQAALFAVLRFSGGKGLATLRRVGFGPYDWPQGVAINVLATLASEGVETKQVNAEILAAIDGWRWETQMRALPGLAALSKESEGIAAWIEKQLIQVGSDDLIDALEWLEILVEPAPEMAKRHADLARRVAEDSGRGIPRTPLQDGQPVFEDGRLLVQSGREYPSIPDLHAIRASLILLQLFPEEAQHQKALQDWAESHPDEQLRAELRQRLSQLQPARPDATP